MQHGPIPAPAGPGIGRRNDVYGGNLIPGYEYNPMNRSWEAPAPQAHNHSGYTMVSVLRTMTGDVHPLILPFHEAECSI
jgi:hypothetical protein